MEPVSDNPVNTLADITRRYAAIDDDDLDIAEIYKQREERHDRGIVFDWSLSTSPWELTIGREHK